MSVMFSFKIRMLIAKEFVLFSICIGLTLLFFIGCLMYNECLKYSILKHSDEIRKIMVRKESKQRQLNALLQTIPVKYDSQIEMAITPSLPNNVRHLSLSKIFSDYKCYLRQAGSAEAGFPQTFKEYCASLNTSRMQDLYEYAKDTYTRGVPKTYADFLSEVEDQLPQKVLSRLTYEALFFAAQKPGDQLKENLKKLSFDKKEKTIYESLIVAKRDVDSLDLDIIDLKDHIKQNSLILNDVMINWTKSFFLILSMVFYPCRLFVVALIWSIKVLKKKV